MSSSLARLTNYDDPGSLGSRLRARRSRTIVELIEASHRMHGRCRVLDVGGTLNYWNVVPRDFLRAKNAKVLLLNLNRTEVDASAGDIFEAASGNACAMPQFADGEFDLVHSNSVVEHVGLWANMQRMADEVRRVGRAYYVQTPNYWFPIEPHFLCPFLHWLPMPWRVNLAQRFALGNFPRARSVSEAVEAQQDAMLLNARMMKALFPDATLTKERFFGLAKSLVAVRRDPHSKT